MSGAPFRGRLIAGAIGGIVGTVVMTAAMRRLHRLLPPEEQYPLPPREITQRVLNPHDEATGEDLSLITHTLFGAAAGALMTARRVPSTAGGSAFGTLVWVTSYFGWVPATRILRPATGHPLRRNLLMISVHLVWGWVTAAAAKELVAARTTILSDETVPDAPAGASERRRPERP